MTTSREQFEQWFTDVLIPAMRVNGILRAERDFSRAITEMAWQASRAAIVVELPDEYFDGIDALVIPYDETVQSLSVAGIAVKGDSDG